MSTLLASKFPCSKNFQLVHLLPAQHSNLQPSNSQLSNLQTSNPQPNSHPTHEMSSHVPNFQSLYVGLGVQLTATREEIRKAYKDRAVRMHPDKVPFEQRAAATFAFQALHDAYEYCLSKVGTNYAKPTVEDEEEEGASGATNDGEEAFWCVRDDVPSEYAAAAGGTGYWKEGDSEAPAAWMNWVKAI
jgi:hypothetical protein